MSAFGHWPVQSNPIQWVQNFNLKPYSGYHSSNKKLTKAGLRWCWSYGTVWMQMLLLLAIVQPHRELHSPLLSAEAETNAGIYVEDFLCPAQRSPLGKAASWVPKTARARAGPVTLLVSHSEHVGASLSILQLPVPGCRQSFPLLPYGLVIQETKFPSVAFSSSQERQSQCPAMLLQQTKFKSLPTSLRRRSHQSSHYNHDTKFDVTDTSVNLELLFHTTEEIPRKKLMEMGVVEGEAPARAIASFFETSGELSAGTANTDNQTQSARLRMTAPRIIPSLLSVISAIFFPQQFPWDLDRKVTNVCVRSSNRMRAFTRFFKK